MLSRHIISVHIQPEVVIDRCIFSSRSVGTMLFRMTGGHVCGKDVDGKVSRNGMLNEHFQQFYI